MKPITKQINDMIATFPFAQYMVDPDEMTTLGSKPLKPIEPELSTKKPTALDLSVYSERVASYTADMQTYEMLIEAYKIRKAKFDALVSTQWDRFVVALLEYLQQDVNAINIKQVNELGSKTGLPKYDRKRMEKTLDATMRQIDKVTHFKPEPMHNLSQLGSYFQKNIFHHDIEIKIIDTILGAFDPKQLTMQPEIDFTENIFLPATATNIQYAVNIISKATGTMGTIEPKITNAQVLIPVAYMVKALQMRLCK